MLGLGGSLLFGGKVQRLIFSYTSDFTSGVDSWEAYNLGLSGGTEGSPTVSGNDSGPDGAGGWLKMEYDQDQSGYSGLSRDLGWSAREGTPEMQGTKKYDYAEINFKIHLVETGSDHWGGSDPVMLTVGALGDGVFGPASSGQEYDPQIGGSGGITQNETNIISVKRYALFSTTSLGGCGDYPPCSYGDGIRLTFQHSADKPDNGAIFYIKDYNIKIYR